MRRASTLSTAFAVMLCTFGCRQDTNTMTPTSAPSATEQVTTRTVTSKDGTHIAFEKAGSGPTAIVVSGALAHRNIYREKHQALLRELSENFTTVIYDRRGRGESSDTRPYAVEREIEDIEALIEENGGRAYLFGSSGGAALSLHTASKLGPGKVTKLALYEPPYGQPKKVYDEQKHRVNELVENGQPGEAAEYFFTAIGTPPEALKELKSSPEWDAIRKIDFTLAYDYQVLCDGSIPQGVAMGIKIPTLVMNGEKGVPFIQASVGELAKLIPGAELKTLKGQAHQADADALAPVLKEFFSSS